MMPDSYPPRCVQRKYPTKATKQQFLEAIVRIRGVDVVTLAQDFRMSCSGVRGKLRRLRLQSLVEVIPGTYGLPKAWQLTPLGWRHLQHLREGQTYGGSKEKLIESLRAEVQRLKAENDHLRLVIERTPGILPKGAGAANENAVLKRALNESRAENKRLEAQIVNYRLTHALRTLGRP